MTKQLRSLENDLAKRESGNFTWEDLDTWAQKQIVEGAKVYVLKKNKWVLVDNVQVLLKEQRSDMDDSFARVVTRPNRPFLNWFLLPIANLRDKGSWVMWGATAPDTDILIDEWYVGDGSEGIVLAAQTNKK